MAMIQNIDAGALIDALRAGRQDRATEMARHAAEATARAKTDLLSQMFTGQPTGLDAQYAPTHPLASPTGPNPDTGGPPVSAPPVSAPPVAPTAPQRTPDPNVLAKLTVIDPEMGGKIATAFKAMSDMEIAQHEKKNAMMGAAAHQLMQYPPEQRAQALRSIAPALLQSGFTPEEISQANLTDQGLQMAQAVSMDTDKMIDNELAQREFEAGKNEPIQPGGSLANVKPDGTTTMLVVPNEGGHAAGSPAADIPHVADEAGYKALSPGAQYYDPQGNLRTKGGGGGNATSNFPNIERYYNGQ